MMKHLLIGASALVLTTVAAQAQIVNPRGQSNQSAVQITTVGNIPVQGGERTTFSDATRSATTKGAATTARNGVSETFDVGASGHAAQYNGQYISGSTGVLSGSESGNKSAIDTRGDNNEAIVDQRGGHTGWAAVAQRGNVNQANIDQDDGIAGTSGTANAASIQQISSNTAGGNFTQKAEINQVHFGTGAGQNASIMQGGFNNDGAPGGTGSNNTARIDQRGSSTVSGVLNDAVVVQTETANNAYIQQGSSSSATYSSHAGIQQKANGDAGVYQTGTTNSRAYVVQFNGAKLTADVVQTGGQNNFAAVSQSVSGSRELTSFVSQSGGSNNSAFVDQSGGVAVTAYGEIFQVGSDNVALISQSASPIMHAQISQTGTGNYAATYQ